MFRGNGLREERIGASVRRWRRTATGLGRRTWSLLAISLFCAAVTLSALADDPFGPPIGGNDPPPNLPPEITDFVGYETPTGWTFTGYVIDEEPAGLVVRFGDLLSEQSTVADDNGYFQYSVELSEGGTVSAQTSDRHNVDSNVAEFEIT
jgi:hypothetical protein